MKASFDVMTQAMQSALSKNKELYTELSTLKAKLEKAEAALESIAQTDISGEAPDFLWLQRWRHNTKEAANTALKEIRGRE